MPTAEIIEFSFLGSFCQIASDPAGGTLGTKYWH
jgi:hypothetical protein